MEYTVPSRRALNITMRCSEIWKSTCFGVELVLPFTASLSSRSTMSSTLKGNRDTCIHDGWAYCGIVASCSLLFFPPLSHLCPLFRLVLLFFCSPLSTHSIVCSYCLVFFNKPCLSSLTGGFPVVKRLDTRHRDTSRGKEKKRNTSWYSQYFPIGFPLSQPTLPTFAPAKHNV